MALYYKTIALLGTEDQADFLRNVEAFKELGCFALTELGHGSNTKGVLTTAHYDNRTREFVINTPCDEAMKFWIGGAAKTVNMSIVFAQLYDSEGTCHGPHFFIVPIRDKNTHLPLPGVVLGDVGKKTGLQGVDNGLLTFNRVRVPRRNMLNKIS